MNEIDQLTMAKVQHQILAEIGATGGSEVLSTREALGGQTLRISRGTDPSQPPDHQCVGVSVGSPFPPPSKSQFCFKKPMLVQ